MADKGSARSARRGGHRLVVPLDAAGVEGFTPDQRLKVVFVGADDVVRAETVALGKDGRGSVTFALDRPLSGRVLVGPADASDDDLQGMQTLAADVGVRAWRQAAELTLAPIVISSYYWHWWPRWCRRFTIRGRVVCPDGNPVPYAQVCAYDVDRWWWWLSEQEVGCATTDASGSFEIAFTWCCGWRPWWWFARRFWRVDPHIAERISTALRDEAQLPPLPRPGPRPDLKVFDALLQRDGVPTASKGAFDAGRVEALRPKLLDRLPHVPDLEALRIWPWWPWRPWSDCTPDITFKVTQNCGSGDVVVLDESPSQARWNVPTTLSVTLVTDDNACCVHPRHPGCLDAGCIALTQICDDLLDTVGGNLGAPAAPAGYRDPGVVATHGDRPYAGTVAIKGVCADWVDYYEFEWSTDGTTWNAMPPAAAGGVTFVYVTDHAPWFIPVQLNFGLLDGRWVVESLGHWESVNGTGLNILGWVGDATTLINWRTDALFPDGTYYLRLRAWQLVGGSLVDPTYPEQCGTGAENRVVVRVDNRTVGAGSGHPTGPGHTCGGAGNVHLCTTEPDTDFVAVRVNGAQIGACSIVDSSEGGTLEIDFLADDPDGHLAYYTLNAYWGENEGHSLLTLPSATLSRLSAAQAGPTYYDARAGIRPENTPAASAPVWEGGTMRLTVTNLHEAFPEPCAYLLDLRAWKRTIVSCDDQFPHGNRSTFTFTVS